MTTLLDHAQFKLPGADTPMQAAAMWRGALIDRFANLEATALDCITLINVGTNAKPANCVAWQRFNQLRQALQDARFTPVSKKMTALLRSIEQEHDLRTGLAHGTMQAKRSGVALAWPTWKGSRWVKSSIQKNWAEALAALVRIDKLQRDFASQAGQVRKLLQAQQA